MTVATAVPLPGEPGAVTPAVALRTAQEALHARHEVEDAISKVLGMTVHHVPCPIARAESADGSVPACGYLSWDPAGRHHGRLPCCAACGWTLTVETPDPGEGERP